MVKITSRLSLVISILCGIAAALGIFYFLRGHRPQQAFKYVCQMVYDKHYYGQSALADWYQKCMTAAQQVNPQATPAEIIELVKHELANIATSHLDVYSPAEDQVVWKGHEEVDSGMRVRAIDGHFIVSQVYGDGAAQAAGVRLGDEILQLAGGGLLTSERIQAARGEVKLRRSVVEGGHARDELLSVHIAPKALQIDQAPQVKRLASDVGLLEISSFRQEYFLKEEWMKTVDQFQDYPSLVVDVRGNLGGDFVAVTRALSVFLCGEKHVGDLVRPRAEPNNETAIRDEASSEELYDLLISHRRLRLQTFSGYPCYGGAVTVLIDGDSASVSEIFALAMKARVQTRVWGERTRGDMLLGVWYALGLLGKGYTLSIPEALYVSPEEEIIEGQGVRPQRELYYRLPEARRGEDSWVKAALGAY